MFTGDRSGIDIARHQPMKLAAAEGLYDGGKGAPLSIIPGIEIPNALSFLATHDMEGFVPGINDIIYKGYTSHEGHTELPATEDGLVSNIVTLTPVVSPADVIARPTMTWATDNEAVATVATALLRV